MQVACPELDKMTSGPCRCSAGMTWHAGAGLHLSPHSDSRGLVPILRPAARSQIKLQGLPKKFGKESAGLRKPIEICMRGRSAPFTGKHWLLRICSEPWHTVHRH